MSVQQTTSSSYPNYRIRGDVDNQLICLHQLAFQKGFCSPLQKVPKGTLSLSATQLFPNPPVYMIENAIDPKLAQHCRDFVQKITVPKKLQQLDDDKNPPKNRVFQKLVSLMQTSDRVDILNPPFESEDQCASNWTMERYYHTIIRLLPKSIRGFCLSPIPPLFEELLKIVSSNIDISGFGASCWVIQCLFPGESFDGVAMTRHRDQFKGRRLSFIYYLTPNDWNYKKDGGALWIKDDKTNQEYALNPSFNTLYFWQMDEQNGGPEHWVDMVKRNIKSGKRIALVGFF